MVAGLAAATTAQAARPTSVRDTAGATRATTAATTASEPATGYVSSTGAPLATTSGGVTVLKYNVLAGLERAQVLGRPAPTDTIHIGVALADRDAAGLAALLHAEYTPGSAQFRQFITPQQFADRFGPDQRSFDAVLAWLRGSGLEIQEQAISRDYVQAQGTIAQVERLTHTTLRLYETGGVRFYANDAPPAVPAGLGIMTVVGLNDLQQFHPFTSDHPVPAVPSTSNVPTVTSPQDLWSIYDQPAENRGQGQTMAIFAAGGSSKTVVKDLRHFENEHGLPTAPVDVIQVGGKPDTSNDTSFQIEWILDTQASTGMAPLVKREDLYFGHSLFDPDVLAVFTQWANDNKDKQASASYGECEASPVDATVYSQTGGVPMGPYGNEMELAAEQVLARANAQGQTLFASTGDTGAYCPSLGLAANGVTWTGDPRPNYPALSPHAVGVGGTVLYKTTDENPKRDTEYAWTYTGGGPSFFLAAPDYQQNITAIVRPCVMDPNTVNAGNPVPSTGSTGKKCRAISDVAAQSGDIATSGYDIYDGSDSVEGGTSLSSPLWLGMWTRIQAAARDQRNGLGYANEALYAIGQDATKYARDFYDITVGDNGFYPATPGWDYVSGWGVPDVANLMRDLAGKTTPTKSHDAPAAAPAAGLTSVVSAVAKTWRQIGVDLPGPALYSTSGDVSMGAPPMKEAEK